MITTVYTLSLSVLMLFSLQAMNNDEQQIVPTAPREQDVQLVPILSNEQNNLFSRLSQEIFEHNIAHQQNTRYYRKRGTQLHQLYHDARYLRILNELASKINPQYLSNTEKQLLERIYEILSRANLNYLLKLMSDPL
jgi:hypothetical protein